MDWNDSNKLSEQSNKVIGLANEYRKTRREWADAKLFLDLRVALKYRREILSRKLSIEKAYIDLVQESIETPEYDVIVRNYALFVQLEAEYKGLEKVLEANQSQLILFQSLIKNQMRNT